MAVTVYEVAVRSGVSQPTVSKILGKGGHLFKPETRKRVEDAARELGYRPNSAAVSISRGRTNAIGVMTSTNVGQSALNSDLLWAMQEELAGTEMHLHLAVVPDESMVSEGFVPRVLREWCVDGLLIGYTHDFPPRL